MTEWDGMRMQRALLGAEIVCETRMTDQGPSEWYSLKLDNKIITLGTDKSFAEGLCFALQRNANAFEPSWRKRGSPSENWKNGRPPRVRA